MAEVKKFFLVEVVLLVSINHLSNFLPSLKNTLYDSDLIKNNSNLNFSAKLRTSAPKYNSALKKKLFKKLYQRRNYAVISDNLSPTLCTK